MGTKIKTETNPLAGADGRFTVTCGEFEKVTDAVVSGVAGYPAEVQAISGNVVTVQTRQVPGHAHIENTAESYAQSASTTSVAAAILAAPGAGTITGVFRIAYEGI